MKGKTFTRSIAWVEKAQLHGTDGKRHISGLFFFLLRPHCLPSSHWSSERSWGPVLMMAPTRQPPRKLLMGRELHHPFTFQEKHLFWILGRDRTRDLRPPWYPESTPIFKEATGVYFHGFRKAMFRSLGLGPEHPGKSDLCWQLWRVG